jgi:hypothetical protein
MLDKQLASMLEVVADIDEQEAARKAAAAWKGLPS